MNRAFEEVKGNLTIQQAAEHFGFMPNRAGFISSPFSQERTPCQYLV